MFEVPNVTGQEIVDNDDLVAVVDEGIAKMTAQKSGPTRDEMQHQVNSLAG